MRPPRLALALLAVTLALLAASASASRSSPQGNRQLLQAANTTVCPDVQRGGFPNPEWPKGRESEAVPYHLNLTQVLQLPNAPTPNRVLFCLVSSGVGDTTDLAPGTTGCVPGSNQTCRGPWDEDRFGSGTAAAAVIGALKNGIGMQGILPGAQIYNYNIFPTTRSSFDASELAAALDDCVREHTARKQSVPAMKLVVYLNMESFMQDLPVTGNVTGLQQHLRSLTARNPDMLVTTFAGLNSTAPALPAAWPEVMAVTGTDVNGSASKYFSAPTNYTSLAAPSEWILAYLSRKPRSDFSGLYNRGVLSFAPAIPSSNPNLFKFPSPWPYYESGTGSVTADLFECPRGVNSTTCPGAAGKICLVQKANTTNTTIARIDSCVNSGGIGVLAYETDNEQECEVDSAYTDLNTTTTGKPWPVMLLVSRLQGKAIRDALAASSGKLTVTMSFERPPVDMGVFSGGQDAAAIAAGVAGLLWSNQPSCTAAQIRRALEVTALQKEGPQGTRNDKYGYGLVQVKAANDYLLANPCLGGNDNGTSINGTTVCPDLQPGGFPNPEWPKGRDSEAVPYTLNLTQALDLQPFANPSKVLFCLVSTGVGDTTDLAPGTTGCVPGGNRTCHRPWDQDKDGPGTMAAAVIGALKNGIGMQGILPGAQMYSYNMFAALGSTSVNTSQLTGALEDCVREHTTRTRSVPDLKLVVYLNMQAGFRDLALTGNITGFQRLLRSLTTRNPNMLVTSFAGFNSKVPALPAAWPEVMAVTGTDVNGSVSQYAHAPTNYTSLAVPSEWILNYLPRKPAGFPYTGLHEAGVLSFAPAIPSNNSNLFKFPAPSPWRESATGSITSELFECPRGVNSTTCPGAAGKICLVQKVLDSAGSLNISNAQMDSCVNNGGVGVLVYEREARKECDIGAAEVEVNTTTTGKPWPVMLLVSRLQGKAIRDALAANSGKLSVTMSFTRLPGDLGVSGGGSEAAAVAAGVAGLLWSAHPDCSAAQIRRALEASALQKEGPRGSRNDKYGYGLVQARAARKYLLEELACTVYDPALSAVATPVSGSNGTVTITVVLRFPKGIKNPPSTHSVARKTINLTTSPAGLLNCASARLVTDSAGRASTTCRRLKAGRATVLLTAPASYGFNQASERVVLDR